MAHAVLAQKPVILSFISDFTELSRQWLFWVYGKVVPIVILDVDIGNHVQFFPGILAPNNSLVLHCLSLIEIIPVCLILGNAKHA